MGKWCLTISKLYTLEQSWGPPPPCIYYSRLSFKQAIWYAVLTSQRREQMLLSKELKKGILSHKLKILPIPESKLKRKRLLLQCWNKNLHKPLVALEQAHGGYSPSRSTEVGDRACVVQSVVRSSPQPLLYKHFPVPRSNCLVWHFAALLYPPVLWLCRTTVEFLGLRPPGSPDF